MQKIDLVLASIAARHRGLVTTSAAAAEGISQATLDNRVRAGVLVRVHHGVYRHAAVPFTHEMRLHAAVLGAGEDALLSHRAAAAWHRWPSVRRIRPEVTSPHTDLPLLRRVDVHRAVRIRPFERTVVRGMPVTSRGKTALDFCAVTPLHIAAEVIAEAIVCKLLKPEEVVSTLERSTGRGVRGTTKLRRIGSTIDEIKDLESVLELRGWRALLLARIPTPEQQFGMVCADGRKVRLDLAWPSYSFGLDWDSKRWHGTPDRKRRTRERHESIVASSWGHCMYGWADVHDTPGDMRREVEGELDARRRRAA